MSVSSVRNSAQAVQLLASKARAADGDTAAQEASESIATKIGENSNGGYAPNSQGLVNKTA